MILFICNGNVARSQIAEELYKITFNKTAVSAGTKVSFQKNGTLLKNDGELALNAVRNIKKLTGIDLSNNKRKMLTEEMLKLAEKIIVMADKNSLADWILSYKDKMEYWEINDPKDYDFDGYKDVVQKIKENLIKLQ